MDTAYVRESHLLNSLIRFRNPPHFRYLTPCLIGAFPQILRVNLEKKCQCLKPPSIAVIFVFHVFFVGPLIFTTLRRVKISLTLEGGVGNPLCMPNSNIDTPKRDKFKSITPWKINMDHNHGGLEDHVPF